MASETSLISFLHPRPVSPQDLAFIPSNPRRGHFVRLGVIAGAVALQSFFFLATVVPGQQVLPGDWTVLQTDFLVDMLYSLFALGLMAALPLANPERARKLVVEPGGLAGFGTRFWLFGLIWTAIGIGLGAAQVGGASPVLNDTVRLQGLVQFVIFVAVAEEMFFRMALTEWFGGIISTLSFVFYHIFVYSVSGGVGWGLALAMVKAGIYGAIFLYEYKAFGLSASIASHAAIDLVSSGVVGPPHGNFGWGFI